MVLNPLFSQIANWILDYIPPKQKIIVNEKLVALQEKVRNIFNRDQNYKFEIRESKSSIRGFAKQYTIDGMEGIDAVSFFSKVQPHVISLLEKHGMHKINLVLTCTMERVDMKSGEVITNDAPFVSKIEIVLTGTDLSVLYKNATDKCLMSMANYQRKGSGWRLQSAVKLDINTATYKPLKNSSYIPLPPVLANKKAIINMINNDDQCFKWCVARALNPVDKNQERITKELQKQADALDWDKMVFPVTWHDIDIFEKQNEGIAVNVFRYEDMCIH